jgi:hypothetical protein
MRGEGLEPMHALRDRTLKPTISERCIHNLNTHRAPPPNRHLPLFPVLTGRPDVGPDHECAASGIIASGCPDTHIGY